LDNEGWCLHHHGLAARSFAFILFGCFFPLQLTYTYAFPHKCIHGIATRWWAHAMQAVNLQLQSICFFLSTRAAKLSAYQNQSTTHQNSGFGGERGQTKDLQFCVIMLFLSLFPISSHIFTLDVCSIFLYMLILLLIFAGVLTFNPCVNQVQSFLCDSKVTSWNWLKPSCVYPIHALVKPKIIHAYMSMSYGNNIYFKT
jgi:hypothetical protein